jgi:Rrf2 family cysteine metabolism transcriptional repressor
MKISTKGQYGLSILIELAKHYGKGPISLKAIANAKQLSEAYLEQIISPIRNNGLVKSIRGPHGGYILAKPASEITAYEMITLLEGPIQIVENDNDPDLGKRELWNRMQSAVTKVLEETTLEDIAKYSNEDNSYMFYI